MAFSYTLTSIGVAGFFRISWGTFTNASSSTGGDIDTGLGVVNAMFLQHTGSAVVANAPVVNETLPGATGSAMTIVTDADASGVWLAIGK